MKIPATYPQPWTGSPQTADYLVLHRVGFTLPSALRSDAVSSYLAFSPLPL